MLQGCLYIIIEGRNGGQPAVSISVLGSTVDRFLVRCILYSLEPNPLAANSIIVTTTASKDISSVAKYLRGNCILPSAESKICMRMLPFAEVLRARKRLSIIQQGSRKTYPTTIDSRTVETRIETVLAGKGIILKKLTSRLRCYLAVDHVEKLLSSLAVSNNSVSNWARPSFNETQSCLDHVSKAFQERKSAYWKGAWSLSNEIMSIPRALWTDTVMTMASRKRISSWTIAARACGGQVFNTFPFSNSIEYMPTPSIEEALNGSSEYSRADLLLCVRALKVIGQIVLSRTNGVAGPLTITASVAGICEVSPSFVSVLNSMGLFLSYNVTERYRQGLIAARERDGPWKFSCTDKSAIPLLQFDNWDIKPLHAVKTDLKAMPKVNGSLMHGVSKKRKLLKCNTELCGGKRLRTEQFFSWRPSSLLGNRERFVQSFNTDENNIIFNQFNDIVFGIACLCRSALVGGNEANRLEYSTAITKELKQDLDAPPVNFTTLLLSCFKPHGGAKDSETLEADQHVLYVEISKDNAADILTVRRFLKLVEEQLMPGRPNRPRYVVLAGDQPSYKMFCELWLDS